MPRTDASVNGKVVLIAGAAFERTIDIVSRTRSSDMDERFARDAAERGAAASSFVGAGGEAARAKAGRRT